jgi:hypothetical protein
MNKAWLQAAKAGDVAAMKALADHFEEQGDRLSAAQWRCKAGLSRVVYQVYNTETKSVEQEYKAMAPCQARIAGFNNYGERSVRRVRVIEWLSQPKIVIQPKLVPRDRWTGPVSIIAGQFSGKSGEVVGYDYRDFRGYRVKIDGVVHVIAQSHLEFLS